MDPATQQELLDANQLADRLNTAPSTVRRLAREGVIPAIWLTSNQPRFEVERVLDALRAREREERAP